MTPRIIFTGGGSAGHVTPNLALIEILQQEGWQINYVGSKDSVEQDLVQSASIPFHAIHSGKLRRYFSWKNFSDPFYIVWGMIQAFFLLNRLKTDIVFSKGGFVAFPVVFAAWLRKIPVVAHESDLSPGLANRLSFPFVNKICVTFAAAKNHFKKISCVEVTGTPIRQPLFDGVKAKGLALCHFTADKPCLLITGGGQGAQTLNQVVRDSLAPLCKTYQIIHLCGKGKLEPSLIDYPGYCQFEYASETLPHLMAAADRVLSRAGANTLYELLALKKPHILVPLSAKVSRGDQVQNARFFREQGISLVIDDEALTQASLLAKLQELEEKETDILQRISALDIQSASGKIIAILKSQL